MRTTRLLGALAAAGLLLAACSGGSSGGGGADPYGSGTTTTAATSTSAGGGGAPATTTVAVATDDQLGEHLVDGTGRTLYLFDQDQGATSACTGGCAGTWPPLEAADAPVAGDGVDQAALTTVDGAAPDQVAYHGHLLYYYAGDAAPGDANGTSIPGWHAVAPSGEAIALGG